MNDPCGSICDIGFDSQPDGHDMVLFTMQQTADAVVAINLIHVAPWSATLALFEGAKALLSTQDVLFLYGPYRRFGRHTSQSNAQFDLDLRTHNPEWGLRDLEAVSDIATGTGFILAETVQMPANNFSLVFRRREG